MKIGENNSEAKKSIPVTTAVRPVLPPSDIPEALSTNVVTVEVPSTAPL